MLAPLTASVAVAQAGPGLTGATAGAAQTRSVGTFDVSPVQGSATGEGRATGAIVTGLVSEAGTGSGAGVIKDFAVSTISTSGSASAAAKVFESIDIKGFTPVTKLQGVGTSSLSLRSEALALTMTDNVNSLLVFRAEGASDQEVALNAADDVALRPSADPLVWHVDGPSVHGVLILAASSAGATVDSGSRITLEGQQRAVAHLKEGTQLVFRANSEYSAAARGQADQNVQAYNEAVVKAIARADLVAEAVTEFSSGVNLIANANFFSDAQARTHTEVESRVTTTLRAALEASGEATASATGEARGRLLAYDVDYVDVHARTAQEVAVYVNGALAQRVESAAAVSQASRANMDAFWATTVEGRVLVLTSVAARGEAATQVTLAALAHAGAAASTLAELDAQSGVTSQVEGGYTLLGSLESSAEGSGQVIGSFTTFFASESQGSAQVTDYTDLRSSQRIFTQIHMAADLAAQAQADVQSAASARAQAAASTAADAAVVMTTKVGGRVVASATFTDSVYAAIQATAEAATQVDFHLSHDIRASLVSESVARLEGPDGKVGYLILAKADGSGQAASSLDLSAAGHVKAILQAQEKVVFRSAAEAQAKASAELAAKAIASGALASEMTLGVVANAIASSSVNYQNDVHAAIDAAAEATHRGMVTLDVASHAAAGAQATAVSTIADRATLAAHTAEDLQVTVDGKAAVLVHTAAEVFAAASAAPSAAAQAKYFVTTNLQGQTQVITSIPSLAAGAVSKVVIESKLDAQARLKAALDVFGQFQPGYGGAATGSIVSLVAKQDAGLILDYTVTARSQADAALGTTTKVFDAVKLGGSAFASASATASHALRWQSEEGVVEAYDVSGAVLKLAATAQTEAAFDLAANIKTEAVSEKVVMLEAPDFSGALVLVDATGQSAFDASAAAQGKVVADLAAGATVVFKAFSGFDAELNEAQKRAQAEAIASGRLLGQVIVSTDTKAQTTKTAAVNYYADAVAVTQVASKDKVEILVDSATHTGKSIILSLDRNTVQGLIKGDAVLLIDGKAVGRAASYEDAFVADADKYWLMTTEGQVGLQAVVTMAHFSTRTITLQSPDSPSIFLWTTLGLGALVVGQAVYPRLRRAF